MTLEESTANNAVLEALASGLPIVAEDVGGTREYVGTSAGRLVPKGDVNGLEAALRGMRDDPDVRARMGRAARERALELSWSMVARQLDRFYEDVLAKAAHV